MRCLGWGVDCGKELTPETERIFGEAILCEECDDRAWRDYFEAIQKIGTVEDERQHEDIL